MTWKLHTEKIEAKAFRTFVTLYSLFKSVLFTYCFFAIYSRYLKRVLSKRDGCEYLKQVPSIDGSLELI
jgi:hypothetical protein